jgi:hypothetical protein
MCCFENEHAMKHARLVSGKSVGPMILLTVAVLASIGTQAFAQSRGRGTTVHSGATRSSTTTRPVGRYRDHGRVRGGSGARPQAQPFLQTNLSGILPPGFGGHTTQPRTHVTHHPFAHHAPRVVYVPVGYYPQQPRPEQVIVVQQAPPVQQPVVFVQAPQALAQSPAPAIPPPPRAPARATSNEPGAIRLSVQPAGAEVVLDDRRLGSASDVSRGQDHVTRPGIHVLEVTHPGHRAERLVFAVDPESIVRLVIDLRETRASRRTRIE